MLERILSGCIADCALRSSGISGAAPIICAWQLKETGYKESVSTTNASPEVAEHETGGHIPEGNIKTSPADQGSSRGGRRSNDHFFETGRPISRTGRSGTYQQLAPAIDGTGTDVGKEVTGLT
jgi:hypothetical protein